MWLMACSKVNFIVYYIVKLDWNLLIFYASRRRENRLKSAKYQLKGYSVRKD